MSRLEDAEARMRALEAEIFQLKRFGRDRFEHGDVIRFAKTYAGVKMPQEYVFAAIKTGENEWFTTASRTKTREKFTYDELIQFVIAYPAATDVEVATSWVDITRVDVVATTEATNRVSPSDYADTRAAEANSDDDVVPLPKRRPVEFGRGLYRPVKDEPEPEVPYVGIPRADYERSVETDR